MKKNIKKLAAVCLTGAMVIGTAGCGNSGSKEPATDTNSETGESTQQAEVAEEPAAADDTASDTAGDGEKISITMSTYLTNDSQRAPLLEYVGGAINEKFPNVDFEFKIYSDRQNMFVEVAGGAGPDILDLDGPTDVVEFADAGKAVDLTPYAEQYGWDSVISEWAYNTSVYDGKLYSMPAGFEGMGMYYNLGVMEEHGWSIPSNLEELESLMEEIKGAGLIPLSFGNANYQGAVDHLYSTLLSCLSGPDVVKQAINGEIKFDDPKMVASIEKLKEWWDKGYIMDQASQTVTQDDQLAFLADGRAVMSICGTWWGPQIVQTFPDCNWTFELMPVLNEEAGPIFPLAVGESYAVNANTQHPEICAEILNFLYTDMDTFYTAVNNGAIQPFPIEAFDFEKLEGMDEQVLHMNEVMGEASADNIIGYCSWSFWPSDARTYMNENFDAVLLGSLTPQEYMANTQQYIDEGLEEGSTPILP